MVDGLPPNGSRYVTPAQLFTELTDHRREETQARHELADRTQAALGERALMRDFEAVERLVDEHERNWQQLAGAVRLVRIAFGTSLLAAVGSVLSIITAIVAITGHVR